MARSPRLVVPGQVLHIVKRGHNREDVFFDDRDYRRYLAVLRVAAESHGVAIHAYVLMTNHVHLLATPADEHGPARMMQSIGRQYVLSVNDARRRSGAPWEGRYKSSLIGPGEYFMACSRYIELNPVRAGLVKMPAQYRWSSYHANARGASEPLLTKHAAFGELGHTERERTAAYRRQFGAALQQQTIERIREATEHGAIFGSERFRRQTESALARRIGRHGHGGDRRSDEFLNIRQRAGK